MTEHPPFLARFAEARGAGQSPDGLVRAEVDGTGELVGLTIDHRAMHLGPSQLSEAVMAAFRGAKAAVQERLADAWSDLSVADVGAIAPDLIELRSTALRQLDEMSGVAQRLADRLERHD